MNDSELSGEIKSDLNPIYFGEPRQQIFHQNGVSGFQNKIAEFKAGLHAERSNPNSMQNTRGVHGLVQGEIPFWQQRQTIQHEEDGDAESSFESALSQKIINERISDTENQRQIENQFHQDHNDFVYADYPQDSLLSAVNQIPIVPTTDFKSYFQHQQNLGNRVDVILNQDPLQSSHQQSKNEQVQFESAPNEDDNPDSFVRKQVCDKCQKTPFNYIALSCGDNFCFDCLAQGQRLRQSIQESIVCSICQKQTLLDSESQFAIERYISEKLGSTTSNYDSQTSNGKQAGSQQSFAYSSSKGTQSACKDEDNIEMQMTEIDRRYSIPREEVIREEESSETILTNETQKQLAYQQKQIDDESPDKFSKNSAYQIKSLEEEEQTSALSPFCRIHPEEEAAFFCWTCEVQCICRKCLEDSFGQHRNHEISRVQGRCQDLQSRLEDTFKDIQTKTTQMDLEESSLSRNLSELTGVSERVLEELKSICSRARAALDQQEKHFTNVIMQRASSVSLKLENQMNKTSEAKKTVLTLARKLAVLQQPQCFSTTDSTESTIAFNYFAECNRILHQIFSKTNPGILQSSQKSGDVDADYQQDSELLLKSSMNFFQTQLDTFQRITKYFTEPIGLLSNSQSILKSYTNIPTSNSNAISSASQQISNQALIGNSFLDLQRKAGISKEIKSTQNNQPNLVSSQTENIEGSQTQKEKAPSQLLLKDIQDSTKANQSVQNVTSLLTHPTCHSVLLDSSSQDAFLNGVVTEQSNKTENIREKLLTSLMSPSIQQAAPPTTTNSMRGLAQELISAFKRGKESGGDGRKSTTIQSIEIKENQEGRIKEKTERSFDSPYSLHQSVHTTTQQYFPSKENPYQQKQTSSHQSAASLFIQNVKKQNFSSQQFQKIVTQLPFQSASKQAEQQQSSQQTYKSQIIPSKEQTSTTQSQNIRSVLNQKTSQPSSTTRALQLMKAQRQERQNRLSEDFKLSNFHVYTEPAAGSNANSSNLYNHLSSHPLKMNLGSPGNSGRKGSTNQVLNELTAFQEAIKSSSIFEREMRKKEAEWEKKGITGGRSPLKNSPGSSLSQAVQGWGEKKKSFVKVDSNLNSLSSPQSSTNNTSNLHTLKALYKSQQANNRATSNISLQKYSTSSSGSASMLSFDTQQQQQQLLQPQSGIGVSSFTNNKGRSSTPTACPNSPPHTVATSTYFSKGYAEMQSSKPLYFMPQKKSQIEQISSEPKRLTKPKSFTSRNLMTMFDKSPTNDFFLRDYHSNGSQEERYSVTPFI